MIFGAFCFLQIMIKKHVIISFSIICLYSFTLIAQNTKSFTEEDYKRIVNIYDQEISNLDTDKLAQINKVVVIHPDTLPGWIFNYYEKDNNKIKVIGISDPNMDSLSGMRQAIFRAEALASLYNESFIGFIADNFKKETGRNKEKIAHVYGQFFNTISCAPYYDKIKLLNTHRTKFDETIVHAEIYTDSPSSDSVITISEALLEEKKIGSSVDIRFRISLSLTLDADNKQQDIFKYTVRGINKHSSIDSYFDNATVQYPKTNCRYHLNESIEISDSVIMANKMVKVPANHGLWNAYMQSVLRTIYHEVFRRSSVETSKVSDEYSSRLQHIKRELTRNQFRILINKIHFTDNHLIVEIDLFQ